MEISAGASAEAALRMVNQVLRDMLAGACQSRVGCGLPLVLIPWFYASKNKSHKVRKKKLN
jgi:uncharacterized protein (DUF2267 family)